MGTSSTNAIGKKNKFTLSSLVNNCIGWILIWYPILLNLKLLTWLPIIGFETSFRTPVPLINSLWEPKHNERFNQCSHLAETRALRREQGGHPPSDISGRWNRSQPFLQESADTAGFPPQCWGPIEGTPLVGVCKVDNMTIVFLPPLDKKAFIRLRKSF